MTSVVDNVLDGGTLRLSKFRDEIEDERTDGASLRAFKSAVSGEIGARGWFRLARARAARRG